MEAWRHGNQDVGRAAMRSLAPLRAVSGEEIGSLQRSHAELQEVLISAGKELKSLGAPSLILNDLRIALRQARWSRASRQSSARKGVSRRASLWARSYAGKLGSGGGSGYGMTGPFGRIHCGIIVGPRPKGVSDGLESSTCHGFGRNAFEPMASNDCQGG
jgi:hypothetical protein